MAIKQHIQFLISIYHMKISKDEYVILSNVLAI